MPKKPPERVLIQYTVDLSEVPGRAKIMLNELADSFQGVSTVCKNIASECETEPIESAKQLARLDKLLTKTKIRVGDIEAILMGYIKILADLVKEANNPAAEEPAAEEEPRAEKPAKKKAKKKKKKTTKKKTKKEEK